VCSLDQELTLLQQGCDITGGNYLKVPQLAGLLQYLLVKLFVLNFVFINVIEIVYAIIELLSFYDLVGFPARSKCEIKTSSPATSESRLQSSVLLPSGTY